MPKELVIPVFVVGESTEAKTMKEKSRVDLRAQNECSCPCLGQRQKPPVLVGGL